MGEEGFAAMLFSTLARTPGNPRASCHSPDRFPRLWLSCHSLLVNPAWKLQSDTSSMAKGQSGCNSDFTSQWSLQAQDKIKYLPSFVLREIFPKNPTRSILSSVMIVLGDCSWLVEKYRIVWEIYVAQAQGAREQGGVSWHFLPVLSWDSAQEF